MDVTLTLIGTAPTDADVAAYMTALQKNPLLTAWRCCIPRSSKRARRIRAAALQRGMHVNPEADLRSGSPVVSALPKIENP